MTNRLKEKRGFTLAELLIVVAIIGVLVAIAIPVLNSQLQKARMATNEANIRSAYTQARIAVMTEIELPDVVYIDYYGGRIKFVQVLNVPLKKTTKPFTEYGIDWPEGVVPQGVPAADGMYKVSFTYVGDNGGILDEMITLNHIGVVLQ